MGFAYEAVDAVDEAFEVFGIRATYTPPGGSASPPIRIVAKSADRVVSFGEGRPFAEGTIIDVRASEVAAPAAGGIFTPGKLVDGTFLPGSVSYAIIGDPERLDDLRLVWTCRVQ